MIDYIRRSDDAVQLALIEGWGTDPGSPVQEPVPANVQAAVLQWASDYPERVFDHPVSTRFFFIHLAAHLGYHLGQVNYHRRLTTR